LYRTDTASIKLLAREDSGALYNAHKCALEYNKKSTAVVSLLCKCHTALEHGDISALIELCGESYVLLVCKEYAKRCPVHFAAAYASDIAVVKPLIREHAPELLTEEVDGDGGQGEAGDVHVRDVLQRRVGSEEVPGVAGGE